VTWCVLARDIQFVIAGSWHFDDLVMLWY